MCVHVFRVPGKMPNGTLVWVDRQLLHTCVLVDPSLFCEGRLTDGAVTAIDAALAIHVPGLTLRSAPSCERPLLRAVAG
jgi:hypothetical protein